MFYSSLFYKNHTILFVLINSCMFSLILSGENKTKSHVTDDMSKNGPTGAFNMTILSLMTKRFGTSELAFSLLQ